MRSAASSSQLAIAAPASAPAPASDSGGMTRETPTNAQARSKPVIPAPGTIAGSKAAIQPGVEATASASTPSVPELKIRDNPANTQDGSMAGGAAPGAGPGSKMDIKSGIGTTASTSPQVSVGRGSTSVATTKVVVESGGATTGSKTDGKLSVGVTASTLASASGARTRTSGTATNLPTESGTGAGAPDTTTGSETGVGVTASTSAPASVAGARTESGPAAPGAGPGSKMDIKSGIGTTTSTSPQVSVGRGSTSVATAKVVVESGGATTGSKTDGKPRVGVTASTLASAPGARTRTSGTATNLPAESGTGAGAPDTTSGSETGVGVTASTSAPASVAGARTESGPAAPGAGPGSKMDIKSGIGTTTSTSAQVSVGGGSTSVATTKVVVESGGATTGSKTDGKPRVGVTASTLASAPGARTRTSGTATNLPAKSGTGAGAPDTTSGSETGVGVTASTSAPASVAGARTESGPAAPGAGPGSKMDIESGIGTTTSTSAQVSVGGGSTSVATTKVVVESGGATTGSKTDGKPGVVVIASTSASASGAGARTSGTATNLPAESGTGAGAPDITTGSETGVGVTASTSAPASVAGARTESGPGAAAPGATIDSKADVQSGVRVTSSAPTPASVVEARTSSKSMKTQVESEAGASALGACGGSAKDVRPGVGVAAFASIPKLTGERMSCTAAEVPSESGAGGSTPGASAGSKAAVAVEAEASFATGTGKPVLGSSSTASDVTNPASTAKSGTSEAHSSLKKGPQHRVPMEVPVFMTDVVDALSGALSARRATQAPVATALDVAQDESSASGRGTSGPRVLEKETATRGVSKDAFRKRLANELITMMKKTSGSCKMSNIATMYRRTFSRTFFLGGLKLRNLLENDGGLAGITLEETADGGVIRLDAPPDSSFTSSGLNLTRTFVNKKALKQGGYSSMEDGSSGRTAETSKSEKTLLANASVHPGATSRGSESTAKNSLERRDAQRPHTKPHKSSAKSLVATDRAPTSSRTSLDHGFADHDRVKLDRKAKEETRTKRGRSTERSRSNDSRYLRGRQATKRDRSRNAAHKQSRDLVDGRVFEGKDERLRRGERGERFRGRSRSRSEDRRRTRSDSRSPNSHGSSRRSADSQSFARSRHGRQRRDNGVSSDQRYEHERGHPDMDRGKHVTAIRVKHEKQASGDETMSRKGYAPRQRRYPVQNSTGVPARGSNFREHAENESMDVTGKYFTHSSAQEDFRRDVDAGEIGNGNRYHRASIGNEVLVEDGARSNKRRLIDGVADTVFHDAHRDCDISTFTANDDRPIKRYAAAAQARGIGGQPSNESAALRGEWEQITATHIDDGVSGMRTDVPASAVLPSPDTIQPLPLSVDRPQGARLIIKGTHPAVPERRIHALASAYGTVGKIEVLEGFVFVHMKYLEEAERAVAGLSGQLLPHISAGRNVPLMADVWSEKVYQALMTRNNMRRYADSMRKASTWYEKHKNVVFDGQTEVAMPCRFFALGRGCVFGHNCVFIHEDFFQAGVTGNAVGMSAVGNGAPPDPLAPSALMAPGRHEIGSNRAMMGVEHPAVRQRVPIDGNREEPSRHVFVQNDEQYYRPPTGMRGRRKLESSGGIDSVPVGAPTSWRPELRRPEQAFPRRVHSNSIGQDLDGVRSETQINSYRGKYSPDFTSKKIGDRREQEYRSVNEGHQGVIPGGRRTDPDSAGEQGSDTEHVAQPYHSRSPRRGPYESRERALSRNETNRDGVSQHGINLDAIDDVHFDFRRTARRGRERTDSRSYSRERPRNGGRITRRDSCDAVHRYHKTGRRDRDISRQDRDINRRDHDVYRQDRDANRRGRSDGRRERDDGRHSSSKSDSGGRYPRDYSGGRRDDMERDRYHDKERRPVRGGRRYGQVRDESYPNKDRSDYRSESRIGDRGRRRDRPRSLSNRDRRAPSHDDDSDRRDGGRARATESRGRDDERGGRRGGREQDVIFSGLRASDGFEDYESGRSSRQALRDHDAADDGMLNKKEKEQEFPDFDDELMGNSKVVGNGGQVKTTFTVTAGVDPQSPQREAVSPPGTTFSVTMPLDPSNVLKSRALQDEELGGRQGRTGRGGRGGRGTRGSGGRGGRFGLYQQRDDVF